METTQEKPKGPIFFHAEYDPATGQPLAYFGDVPARDLDDDDIERIPAERLAEIMGGPAPLYSLSEEQPEALRENVYATRTIDGLHGEPSRPDVEGHFAAREAAGETVDPEAMASAYEAIGEREKASAIRFQAQTVAAEKRAAVRKARRGALRSGASPEEVVVAENDAARKAAPDPVTVEQIAETVENAETGERFAEPPAEDKPKSKRS